MTKEVQDTRLRLDLVGIPILETLFKQGARSDRSVFNIAALLIGLAVSFFFLRQPRFVAMVFLCPLFSVLGTHGVMGGIGQEFSVLMGAAPPLIIVISFANAMHLVQPMMRAMQQGVSRDAAISQVVREVGPACLLALATTGLALLCLIVSGSGAIRDFAVITSIGMAMTYLGCIVTIPVMGRLLLPEDFSR